MNWGFPSKICSFLIKPRKNSKLIKSKITQKTPGGLGFIKKPRVFCSPDILSIILVLCFGINVSYLGIICAGMIFQPSCFIVTFPPPWAPTPQGYSIGRPVSIVALEACKASKNWRPQRSSFYLWRHPGRGHLSLTRQLLQGRIIEEIVRSQEPNKVLMASSATTDIPQIWPWGICGQHPSKYITQLLAGLPQFADLPPQLFDFDSFLPPTPLNPHSHHWPSPLQTPAGPLHLHLSPFPSFHPVVQRSILPSANEQQHWYIAISFSFTVNRKISKHIMFILTRLTLVLKSKLSTAVFIFNKGQRTYLKKKATT